MTSAIHPQFSSIESRYEGNLYIMAHELGTENYWVHRHHDLVATASTIKLPILVHTAMCVHDGYLTWDTEVTLKDDDKVGGMGVLRHIDAPKTLTLRDACYLMTAISDNTATNLVIDVVGVENINQFISRLGLQNTRLNRKAFSPDNENSRKFGLGQTNAADMFRLLNEIYRPESLPEAVTTEVKRQLSLQQDLVAIARVLPHGWSYAGKTGRVLDVRGDVGYVRSPQGREWIMAMFCYGLTTENWTIENQGLLSIAEATRHILEL